MPLPPCPSPPPPTHHPPRPRAPPVAEFAVTQAGPTVHVTAPRAGMSEDAATAMRLEDELARKDEELLNMRVRTLFGMVDAVRVDSASSTAETKQVLFLKRSAASRIQAPDVPKLLAAMGLSDHKLVLRLPRAMSGLALEAIRSVNKVWSGTAQRFCQQHQAGIAVDAAAFKTIIDESLGCVGVAGKEVDEFFSSAGAKLVDIAGGAPSLTKAGMLELLQQHVKSWADRARELKPMSAGEQQAMEEQLEAESRLQAYMDQVLLPVAMRTRALVVVDGLEDACVVARALDLVAKPILAQVSALRLAEYKRWA